LQEHEKELFAPYLNADMLSVEKVLEWPISRGSQRYYGTRLRNSDFSEVRNAGKATEMRGEYSAMRIKEKYKDLPSVTTKDGITEALSNWELGHPGECKWMSDEGQFFGFKEVGEARLERFTHFVHIPAVREAAEDALEGRGSPITELLDIAVRNALTTDEKFVSLQDNVQKNYTRIV
jgi:hypothetical protein